LLRAAQACSEVAACSACAPQLRSSACHKPPMPPPSFQRAASCPAFSSAPAPSSTVSLLVATRCLPAVSTSTLAAPCCSLRLAHACPVLPLAALQATCCHCAVAALLAHLCTHCRHWSLRWRILAPDAGGHALPLSTTCGCWLGCQAPYTGAAVYPELHTHTQTAPPCTASVRGLPQASRGAASARQGLARLWPGACCDYAQGRCSWLREASVSHQRLVQRSMAHLAAMRTCIAHLGGTMHGRVTY
jgi:hypothetical protein